jgi:hypothetical protein
MKENHDMSTFLPKSILSFTALVGLAGGFLALTEPADAAKKTCIQRYRACNQRCAGATGPGGDWMPCINRTCNKQYDNCVGEK